MPRQTLTISLSLTGDTLELELASGNTITLREGQAEEILISLLRKHRGACAPNTLPRFLPADCIPPVRKFTRQGREILPELALADLDL